MSYTRSSIISEFPPGSVDAFGRFRVSSPYTMFDSQFRYQDNNKWDTAVTAGGSVSHDSNSSLINMNVTTEAGSQVIRQTKRIIAYQPGKSLLILSTFTLAPPKENLRQRIGYFDSGNGIFIEQAGQTINFVLRSSISGSVNERRIQRSNWNVDKLDGNGPSGINLENKFNYSLILWIDIEWLGVGDVRIGFILGGKHIHCHTFKHTAESSDPIVGTYMTTACLPLRAEITNLGQTNTPSTLKQICSSVVSEAGFEGIPKSFDINLGTTAKRLTDKSKIYPIISLRLASTRIDSIVVPSSLNIGILSNQVAQYKLIVNGTLTDSSWSDHSNNIVQYDVSATAISGGTDILSGYVPKQGAIDISNVSDFKYQIGKFINGTSDIVSLVISSNADNVDILASLGWFEYIT